MVDDEGTSCRPLVLLAIVIAAVMFVFPLFVPFPLLDPDEGLHALIAQEMVERGNWITPTVLGRPFFDKPILYSWIQAASLKLLGQNETAVRLPGLLFGLLGAATTGLLAWRMFGRKTGWIAGVFYATTILPTALAQAASHDVALVPWVNLTILLLWESSRAVRGRAIAGCTLGAGLFLGLSILTKGLSGVAVVGVAYGGYLLVHAFHDVARAAARVPLLRRSSAGRHPFSGTACRQAVAHSGEQSAPITWRMRPAVLFQAAVVLLIAAIVAAPWYLAVESQQPGFLRYYFVDRHLLGFATDTQPHSDQPWWYYLPILLGGGLPWIGYVRWAGNKGLGIRDWGLEKHSRVDAQVSTIANLQISKSPNPPISNPRSLIPNPSPVLWFWLIGWTVFLTVAKSKLATYLWPAFPPMAILAAVAWTRLIDGSNCGAAVSPALAAGTAAPQIEPLGDAARRSFARVFIGSSWGGPIVLPAAVAVLHWSHDVHFAWPVWLAVGLTAAISPLPLVAWRAGRWQASLAAAALSLAVQFVVVITFVLPPVANDFSARELAEHFNRLGQFPTRLLVVDERIGSLVFYLDPQLRAGLKNGQLVRLLADSSIRLQPGDVVALPERKLSKAVEYLDLHDAACESVGRYRLYRIAKPQAID